MTKGGQGRGKFILGKPRSVIMPVPGVPGPETFGRSRHYGRTYRRIIGGGASNYEMFEARLVAMCMSRGMRAGQPRSTDTVGSPASRCHPYPCLCSIVAATPARACGVVAGTRASEGSRPLPAPGRVNIAVVAGCSNRLDLLILCRCAARSAHRLRRSISFSKAETIFLTREH